MAAKPQKSLETANPPVSLKEICLMKALHFVASPSPVGAAEPENGHWRNGGRKTSATVASTVVQDDKIVTTRHAHCVARKHPIGRRWRLQQGIHPSDHLNQASARQRQTASAVGRAEIAERCIRTREAGSQARARTHARHGVTRETLFAPR